jgi:hypothetical protein
MEPLDRLLAHEEIRQLAARYALAVDIRHLDMLVALFVPDVRVGGDRVGGAALREDFDRQLRAIGRSILDVGTHVIEVQDDDHATGFVYCRGEIEAGGRWIRQAIAYEDSYRGVGAEEARGTSRATLDVGLAQGSWRFVRRIHRLWYGAEPGVNPLNLPPGNWPEHHDGLGTVPECFESGTRFWS